jgi:hypothetical protein
MLHPQSQLWWIFLLGVSVPISARWLNFFYMERQAPFGTFLRSNSPLFAYQYVPSVLRSRSSTLSVTKLTLPFRLRRINKNLVRNYPQYTNQGTGCYQSKVLYKCQFFTG